VRKLLRSAVAGRVGMGIRQEGRWLSGKASPARAGVAVALEPEVQRGDGSDVSGFPLAADMHNNIIKLSPGLEIRLKEI